MLSEKLKELREASECSMEVVAGFISKSQSAYFNYEHGSLPNSETIKLLCRFFGVTPNELLEWE